MAGPFLGRFYGKRRKGPIRKVRAPTGEDNDLGHHVPPPLESNYSWSRPQSLFAVNAARLATHQRPELSGDGDDSTDAGSGPRAKLAASERRAWLQPSRSDPCSQSPLHETVTNDNSRRIFRPVRPWIDSRCGVRTDGPTSWNPGGETAPTAPRGQKTWRWSWSATSAGSVRSPGSFRTPTTGLARRSPTSVAGIAASGTAARSPGTRRAPWVTHCRRRRSASGPCRERVHARRRGPRSRWRGRACDTRAR